MGASKKKSIIRDRAKKQDRLKPVAKTMFFSLNLASR